MCEFVNGHAHYFEELLMGSAEQLKAEFQRRIRSITLTPSVDERGPLYVLFDAEFYQQVDFCACKRRGGRLYAQQEETAIVP